MFGSGNICGLSHEIQRKVAKREIRNEFQSEAIYFENGTSCIVGDFLHSGGAVCGFLSGYACTARNTGKMESEINRCFYEDIWPCGR